VKRHHGCPGFRGPFQKTPAAGECFLGVKVYNRIPVESFDEDGMQYRVNSVDKHFSLRADFEGQVAGGMTWCRESDQQAHRPNDDGSR